MRIKMQSLIIFLILIFFSFSSYAQDIYSDNVLNIPKVLVGSKIYTNVKLTIAKVISVNGGESNQNYDIYDTTNNILKVSNVIVGNSQYSNVTASIDKVLSVDDWLYLDPSQWKLSSITQTGVIDLSLAAPMKNGHFNLLAVGDLNGDGNDDLVLGPLIFSFPDQFVKVVIAFYNPKNNTFEVDPILQSQLPTMQFADKAFVGDFNNDGYKDILISGHGPDDIISHCGEAPVLLLGSKKGLIDGSSLLPRFSMDAENMVVSDFNEDGVLDILFLNSQIISLDNSDPRYQACSFRKFPPTNDSFLILSSNGGFNVTKFQINSIINQAITFSGNTGFSSVSSYDVDSDGHQDLIISTPTLSPIPFNNFIFTGDGKGSFKYHSTVYDKPFGNSTRTGGITNYDVDGDGFPEMIINYVINPSAPAQPYMGSIFKVYKLDKEKKIWKDISQDYFPSNYNQYDTNLINCENFKWVDLNKDGLNDLVCDVYFEFPSDDPNLVSPRTWLKSSKEGPFLPAYFENISVKNQLRDMMPALINSKLNLVGISTLNNPKSLSIQLAR
jgi:hypothetical protein